MIKVKSLKCIRSSFRQTETCFSEAFSYSTFEDTSAVLRGAQIRVNKILCLCDDVQKQAQNKQMCMCRSV